jgi:hypothetical protein
MTHLSTCSYKSSQEFMDDIKQIANNAFSYNSPGRGLFANPDVLGHANTLLQVCANIGIVVGMGQN